MTSLLWVLLLSLSSERQAPPSSDAAKLPALDVPGNTVVLAKLTTNLDLGQSKPGGEVEAETTDDVSQGKTVVLKKGSIVIGHISFVEPVLSGRPDNVVGIQFDQVKAKNGGEHALHMIVRALAPQALPATNPTQRVPHPQAISIEPLSESSVGVSGVPGLRLGVRRSSTGQQTTVLAWTKGDVKLKKGAQLVMVVVGQ